MTKTHIMGMLPRLAFLALGLTVMVPGLYAQNGGTLSMPDWMQMDPATKTITLEVVAGKTDAYNHWNFNGYAKGEAAIVVPEGFTVNMTFKNNDPVMVHSMGIGAVQETYPAMFTEVKPVFEGALSANPTDMMNATKPGTSETLTFKASRAGKYVLLCYVPGHATTGMWIGFVVSGEGKAGLLAH